MDIYETNKMERDDFHDDPRDEATVLDAVRCYLLNLPFIKTSYCSPRETVTSHFVNPLRTFGTVKRFLDGKTSCEVFKTYNMNKTDWCVLDSDCKEVREARGRIGGNDPDEHGWRWEYLLTRQEEENWCHSFLHVPQPVLADSEGHPKDRELGEPDDDRAVAASPGWIPAKSGVRMLLRDVGIGDDANDRLNRPEMLLGLARHIASEGVWHKVDARCPSDTKVVPLGVGVSSLQRSRSGLLYYIYSFGNSGPTHIFTEAER